MKWWQGEILQSVESQSKVIFQSFFTSFIGSLSAFWIYLCNSVIKQSCWVFIPHAIQLQMNKLIIYNLIIDLKKCLDWRFFFRKFNLKFIRLLKIIANLKIKMFNVFQRHYTMGGGHTYHSSFESPISLANSTLTSVEWKKRWLCFLCLSHPARV